MTTNNSWTRYSAERPTEAGIYEWRVPSKAVPGVVLIVASQMRMRGAGFETVLSPEFDYWDGYRVHVLCDVEWRPATFVPAKNQRTPALLGIEGLQLSPCSHCGNTPRIEAMQRDSLGTTICPDPWKLNIWRLVCCSWGNTPWMTDPREIERIRRTTRGRNVPDLLEASIQAAGSLAGAMSIMTRLGYAKTANAMRTYHDALVAAIAQAPGDQP